MDRLKHYYLIIVSYAESEIDGVKLQISLEGLWTHLSDIHSQSTPADILFSVIHLNSAEDNLMVPTATSWTNLNEAQDSQVEEHILSNENDSDGMSSLEVVIHRLCNELPLSDFSVVDLIWITNEALNLPNFQNNIQLYGALKRLTKWYKARITVGNCEDVFGPSFSWGKALPLQIVKYPFIWSEILHSSVFWRGEIKSRTSDVKLALEGFQMRSTNQSRFPVGLYDDYLTIVDEVPLTSIPPYMLSSEKYELLLPLQQSFGASNFHMEKSWEFLSDANARKDMVLILKAGLKIYSKEKKDMDYKTWKQCNIEDNNEEIYNNNLTMNFENCHLFVLIGDGLRTPYSASLWVLKDPSHFNFSTVRHWIIHEAYTSCDCANEPKLEITKSLQKFSLNDVIHLGKNLNDCQKWMLQKWDNDEMQLHRNEMIVAVGAHMINKFKENCVDRERNSAQHCNNLKGEVNAIIQERLKTVTSLEKRLIKILRNARTKSAKASSFMERLSMQMKMKTVEENKDLVTPVKTPENVIEVSNKSGKEKFCRKLVFSKDGSSSRDMNYKRNNNGCEKKVASDANILGTRYLNTQTSFEGRIGKSTESQHLQSSGNFGKENSSNQLKKPKVNERPRQEVNKKICRKSNELSDKHMQKLRIAVVDALASIDIKFEHKLFKPCARKLLEICKTFAKDVIGIGRTSEQFEKLAFAHVQQVVQFHERILNASSKRL